CAKPHVALQSLRITVLLLELQYRRQDVVISRVKCAGTERYVFNERHIKDSLWPTRTALSREMIDHRYFNSVEVVDILIGSSAPDDNVIAKTCRSRRATHARKRLDNTGDIEVASGIVFDFLGGQPLYGKRCFDCRCVG